MAASTHSKLICILFYDLTLFYMGFFLYVKIWGGSKRPPLAKCFLRQPICMEMTKNGSQYKILVFSCPYIPKTVFFDDYISRERSRNKLGKRHFLAKIDYCCPLFMHLKLNYYHFWLKKGQKNCGRRGFEPRHRRVPPLDCIWKKLST